MNHREHIAAFGRNQNYKLQITNYKQVRIKQKDKKTNKNKQVKKNFSAVFWYLKTPSKDVYQEVE